jgi:hypothetical protein
VGASISERHAEALRAAEGDVRPEFARSGEKGQAEEIASHGDPGPGRVGPHDELAPVLGGAVGARVLDDDPENAPAEVVGEGIADHDVDVVGGGSGSQDGDGLRVATVRNEDRTLRRRSRVARGRVGQRLHHVHCLGGGRRLVEQRRVGDFESRQIAHHRLKVEEGLEATLGDLGLVRRVLRVPPRILQDISLNHRWGDAVGVAHAEIAPPNIVLRRNGVQLLEQGVL